MKKRVYSILIFLVVFKYQPVFSQLKFGVHGGVNISSLEPAQASTFVYGDFSYYETRPVTRYYAGVYADLRLNKYLALIIDLVYSEKGYKSHNKIFGLTSGITQPQPKTLQTKTNVIKLPELRGIIVYGLPLGSGKASIGVGATIAYPVAGTLTKTEYYYDRNEKSSDKEDMEDLKIAPGAAGILKYEFNNGLFFEVLYNYINKPQEDVNLSVFEFGTGFNFRFKNKRNSSK
jgi:hypothetical protein